MGVLSDLLTRGREGLHSSLTFHSGFLRKTKSKNTSLSKTLGLMTKSTWEK